MSSPSAWGNETQFFFEITPEKVLQSVEDAGYLCTGRCTAMGSFENRVYDVEIDLEGLPPAQTMSDRFRIVKFYRPGRWTEAQILEEHGFLKDLVEQEIPVVAPLPFKDGSTLRKDASSGIYYTLFPRVGGRSPDELDKEQLTRIGRLLARIHQVGAMSPALHRIELNEKTYGSDHINYLRTAKVMSPGLWPRYEAAAQRVIDTFKNGYAELPKQRIHGDCHFGNLLWGPQGPFFLDFDDFVMGPAVQDFWLMIPGHDEEARGKLRILLDGYQELRDLPMGSLRWIEPLRGLRLIHFAAWISHRWNDPAFPKAFPQYGGDRYWEDQIHNLEELPLEEGYWRA